ncbi:TetR family transcriptional regulator [Amycolatopsis sp. RM579]|uniref:TetR family transcriptional regulator n=1 Tax=Amycolatopsis pithecellobii TaxID=664692 RepID=A0A6N7YXS6_9PSEU|nr:TetR family transcriptional regulator [Amycolatopsis pithecellobii]
MGQDASAGQPTDWRSYGPSPLPKILRGALGAFAEHGYQATSIRELATAAELSVPGLYHHYQSKQEILVSLLEIVYTELLDRSRAALASGGDDPLARFDASVESLLRFHMFRRAEAFVASTELRSLIPENRSRCVALRDEQQEILATTICDARKVYDTVTEHAGDAARALSTMCVGVATWYREDGPLSPDEIVKRYLGFARGLIGAAGQG